MPPSRLSLLGLCALAAMAFLSGCSSPPPYRYVYIPGKTAVVRGGIAIAPRSAPSRVKAAIEAGNRITGLPYRMGGGHGHRGSDSSYDCSGAASFVLREAGLLKGSLDSRKFRHYGWRGKGHWISIYARRGHVFLVVAGLRFDTGYGSGARGPQWTTGSRPATGCVIRHPLGY